MFVQSKWASLALFTIAFGQAANASGQLTCSYVNKLTPVGKVTIALDNFGDGTWYPIPGTDHLALNGYFKAGGPVSGSAEVEINTDRYDGKSQSDSFTIVSPDEPATIVINTTNISNTYVRLPATTAAPEQIQFSVPGVSGLHAYCDFSQ